MMGSNERKLLPYEHQLVESLGITKEEYLSFVAQQHIYSDPKEGSLLDIRNDFGVVAIVLTIIGTILQVVGALLLEQPKGQKQQTRDTIFAPRSGFNSLQELAEYGDPVNLIYTSTDSNRNGGVRVSTSLLWSAVKSFGSSQYIQLLLLLGAGGIGKIDFERTAFGQTPIRELIAQNYWLYFRENDVGAIRGTDLKAGGEGKDDPGVASLGARNPYRINPSDPESSGDGFSFALSPATSNAFGVYGPVPINVEIFIRAASGAKKSIIDGISASGLSRWGASSPNAVNTKIDINENLTITIKSTEATKAQSKTERRQETVKEEAADHRRSLASVFDSAGIFKLGSAKFAVISVSRGSTDEGDVIVQLRCIEAGIAPSTAYAITSANANSETIANADFEYLALKAKVDALILEDERGNVSLSGIPKDVVNSIFGGKDKVKELDTAQGLLNDGRIFVTKTTVLKAAKVDKKGKVRHPAKTKTEYIFKRNLTEDEKAVLTDFIAYETAISEDIIDDERFFTKAIVKIETASYETVSPCHIVDLAIRARVFRRISGRQERYGSKGKKGYPVSDNGVKTRSAMFLLKYKTINESKFVYVKGVFVVRRSADVDNYVAIKFNSGLRDLSQAQIWQFELEPIHDTIAEVKKHVLSVGGNTNFFYIENNGTSRSVALESGSFIEFQGDIESSRDMLPPRSRTPRDTSEWDLFSNTADTQLQMSFDSGPEFNLTAVTEQVIERFSNFTGLYDDLSLVGFNIYSGRNVQDLRSLSMFVTQGRYSRLLRTSGTFDGIAWGQPNFNYLPPAPNGHANTAPDIFIDTIIDRNDGIGKYSRNLFSVDLKQLAESKKFCETNNLHMDGVIAEPTSWRQFWATNAPFSLLELAKRDGKEALIPGVPYDPSTGQITRNIQITALFNQGNILEDSYKEEFIDYGNNTEDVIVTAIYRDNERDGAFPKNNSVDVQLSGVDENVAMRETIDLSQFVTRRSHAILLGKFLCQTRRHSRRAIEFKTFPTDSLVTPGGFIYVDLAQNQWNNIESGSIGTNGELNLPLAKQVKDGSYQVLMYNPNDPAIGTVFKNNVAISGNRASSLAAFIDYIFVLGTAIRSKRVFRITEVAMDEEGEVTIRGVEHPTDENGLSLISEGLNTTGSGLFAIDGRPE